MKLCIKKKAISESVVMFVCYFMFDIWETCLIFCLMYNNNIFELIQCQQGTFYVAGNTLMLFYIYSYIFVQIVNAADLLKTHVTGVINHGHGGFRSFIDINEYPHDPNLTINMILETLKETANRYVSSVLEFFFLRLT